MPEFQLGDLTSAGLLTLAFWFGFFFMLGGAAIKDTEYPERVRAVLFWQSFGMALFCAGVIISNVIVEDEKIAEAALDLKIAIAAVILGAGMYIVSILPFGATIPVVGRYFRAYQLMNLREQLKTTQNEIQSLERLEDEELSKVPVPEK